MLTVKHHTKIMQAVIDNHFFFISQLPVRKLLSEKKQPTAKQALGAATQLPQIQAPLKAAIQNVLDQLPDLEKQMKKIPAPARAALNELDARLSAAGTPTKMLQMLRTMHVRKEFADVPGFSDGIKQSIAILEDGLDTIYNSNNAIFRMKPPGPVAKEDIKGAVAGAVAGAITGAGALVTSAVGGIASSVGELAKQLLSYL